jgi:hypothetical protein
MGRSRHVDAGPLAHDTIIFFSSFFFFPSKEGRWAMARWSRQWREDRVWTSQCRQIVWVIG